MSSEDNMMTVQETVGTTQQLTSKIARVKQKKFNKKQKKIDKKQTKLDMKIAKTEEVSSSKKRRFKRKQRKIDRKQIKLNKKGVKWGLLPKDVLPERPYYNFKEFIAYMREKLYIENTPLRIIVRLVCIIVIVSIVIMAIADSIEARQEKEWLEDSYKKCETINAKINDMIAALGGEPEDEDDVQKLRRKLDKVITMLEEGDYNSATADAIDSQISQVEQDIVEVSEQINDNSSVDASDDYEIIDTSYQDDVADNSADDSEEFDDDFDDYFDTDTSDESDSSSNKGIKDYIGDFVNMVKTAFTDFIQRVTDLINGNVKGIPEWFVNILKTLTNRA